MSGEYPPITCKELKATLSYLGFVFDTQTYPKPAPSGFFIA